MIITSGELQLASLFRRLPDYAVQKLAEQSQVIELAAGEVLFDQDTSAEAFFILVEGQIHIIRQYASGDEVILATENPYYVIGELSAIAQQPRTGSVVAVSDCTLISIERSNFINVCADNPTATSEVINYLGERLYKLTLMVRENAIGNMAARIATTLLLLTNDKSGALPMPIRVSKIARAVATDADSVERILKEWTKLGHIDFTGRELTIRNAEAMRDIAG